MSWPALLICLVIFTSVTTFVSPTLYVKPIAGTGVAGPNNGGPATLAQINAGDSGLWADSDGNVLIADQNSARIRRVSASSGIISIYGGSGTSSSSGGSGPIGSVNFWKPFCMVADVNGRYLYISDLWYVWKHDVDTGSIVVFVGTAAQGFSGDGGPVGAAQLHGPRGLWMTTAGVLYIVDSGNYRIRTVSVGGTITTFAGSGVMGSTGDGGPALIARLNSPCGIFVNTNGVVYIADSGSQTIRRIGTNSIISTFAGTGMTVYNGDNIPATLATLYGAKDVKGDILGNIYLADEGNCRIRKVDSFGIITTFLGNQQCATSLTVTSTPASLYSPKALWVDSQANLYFNEGGVVIRQTVTSESLLAPTLAPTSAISSRMFLQLLTGIGITGGSDIETGIASLAAIAAHTLWLDDVNNVYFSDGWGRIRKIDSASGIITVFGGTGASSTAGIPGPITSVSFRSPYSIVGDTSNSFLYICDQQYVWKYSFASGIATVFVGTSVPGFSGDNGPAIVAKLQDPLGIWLTTAGDLYIADFGNHRIRKVTTSGTIAAVAGGTAGGFFGDNGPATVAKLYYPRAVCVDASNGKLYIADTSNNRVRVVDTSNSIITFAGNGGDSIFTGDNVLATLSSIGGVNDVKMDSSGNVFIASGFQRIFKVNPAGILSNFIGTGSAGFTIGVTSLDTGIATPTGIWIDSQNMLYFTDQSSIRKTVLLASTFTLPSPYSDSTTNLYQKKLAGGYDFNYTADSVPANSARVHSLGFWVSPTGTIYYADPQNFIIRKVSESGIITTVGGTAGVGGSVVGASGLIAGTQFDRPSWIVGDEAGNYLYICDRQYIWKYAFSTGMVSVIAGTSVDDFSGDDGPASLAQFRDPAGVWLTTGGDLYVADSNNNCIRKISTVAIITTAAGSCDTVGDIGNISGDDGPATLAQLYTPMGVYVNSVGSLYIADMMNNRIRLVNVTGIIGTFAGTGYDLYNGDNIPASLATVYQPNDVKGDRFGNIYVADTGNCRIRIVDINEIISTLLGDGLCGLTPSFSSVTTTSIDSPQALWIDSQSKLYFSNNFNSIHKTVLMTPTSQPSTQPSSDPTLQPVLVPTSQPSRDPSGQPTGQPGSRPSSQPTGLPSCQPTCHPSRQPTSLPSSQPSCRPSSRPSCQPSSRPSGQPSSKPSSQPSCQPLSRPSGQPSSKPSSQPSCQPLSRPSGQPSSKPSSQPSCQPSSYPSTRPSAQPTCRPSSQPSPRPSGQPSSQPSSLPSCQPMSKPSSQPSAQPSSGPSSRPTGQPWSRPSSQPSCHPSSHPSSRPSGQPRSHPTSKPIFQPTSTPSGEPMSFPNLFMKLIAGTEMSGSSGDNGPATDAAIIAMIPWADSNGDIYVPEYNNCRIRRIDHSTGIITTFGGTGAVSTTGNPGLINEVSFSAPYSIVGNSDVWYISDYLYIWKYNVSTNYTNVVAGELTEGFSGDNGPASLARLNTATGLWLNSLGVLFFADTGNHRIRSIPVDGIITTVAGSGAGSVLGDNGPATLAILNGPSGVYMNTVGRLFIADQANHRIRVVDTNNIITTFAGTGSDSYNGDNIKARKACLSSPTDVKGDVMGNIYIADLNNYRIRIVDKNGIIRTLFGTGVEGFSRGMSPAASVIGQVNGIWLDSNSTIYFSDMNSIHQSLVVSSPTSQPSNQPSSQPTSEPRSKPTSQPTQQPSSQPIPQPSRRPSSQPTGQPRFKPTFQPSLQPTSSPTGDPMTFPNLFMELIAGKNVSGFSGDNGPATAATINSLHLWVNSVRDIYFSDSQSYRFRRIDSNGIIASFGGNGTQSKTGSPGLIQNVSFYSPFSVVGNNDSLYITDQWYVWQCDLSSGYTKVIAGTAVEGSSGENGPSSLAKLKSPKGLWLTTAGVLYIADSLSQRIKMISTSGILTTVAGYNAANLIATGFGGDDGLATSAFLNSPSGVYMNTFGKLFIADANNHRIRVVDTNNIITTFAGTGLTVYNGDNMKARNANLNNPMDVKGDAIGNIYIADSGNLRIRVVSRNGMIATFFGTGISGFSYGISLAMSNMNSPYGIWVDSSSTVYFSDRNSIHRSLVMSSQPSQAPSNHPTGIPTVQPVLIPTTIPTTQPTNHPSSSPSSGSSSYPSTRPSVLPSSQPNVQPSSYPTSRPTVQPSCWPTAQPTKIPSVLPTSWPTEIPSVSPSIKPTLQPSAFPSCTPTAQLSTSTPSCVPTLASSNRPTATPTDAFPSVQSSPPLEVPSAVPMNQPSSIPSMLSSRPSLLSSGIPTCFPSIASNSPTVDPSSVAASSSFNPILVLSYVPSSQSTVQSTISPTICPSLSPTSIPTCQPSRQPTAHPSKQPLSRPSSQLSRQPSSQPSLQPTSSPSSSRPTSSPTLASSAPTPVPAPSFSASPSTTRKPTRSPSAKPTRRPTAAPTRMFSVFPLGSKNFRGSLFLLGIGSGSSETDSNNLDLNNKLANQKSYIVFGEDYKKKKILNIDIGSSRDSVSLSSTGVGMSRETTSRSVTIVGDINNDGNDDLIIGFPVASTCLVYFGANNGFTNLIVSFAIYGAIQGDDFGWSVSKAGNINQDEYEDFVICAKTAGICYVLYGKTYFKDIYVEDMAPEDGFRIYGSASTTICFGAAVDFAGDFNKDGYDDLVISTMSFTSQGIMYVILGRPIDELKKDITVNESSSLIYSIITPSFTFAGLSLAGIGDMNKDGFDDIAIGSVPYRGGYQTQRSYVVFGRSFKSGSRSLDVNEMIVGKDGFTITGGGFLVSGVGDLNEDGIADLMITSDYDWRGKSTGYLINYPSNMTASPTYFPSSSPSSQPSVSPSVFPSQAPTTSTPTNLPSVITSPPVLGINESASPTVIQSSKPSKKTNQPTVKSTFIPSYTPSTKTPSCEPSFVPSLIPSKAPFSNRTRRPQPTIRYRPSAKPIMSPTPIPTSGSIVSSMNSLSFSVVDLIEPGDYIGSANTNQNFVFSLTGPGRYHIVARPPHINDSSVEVFSLKPMNDQLVIIDGFRTSSDIIDLHQFPLIQTLDDISFSTNPLTILLPKWVTDADPTTQSRQSLTITTFQTFESFSEQNFIFRKAKGFRSGVKTSNYSFQLLLAFGVIIGVLSVIGFLKCLTEDLNEEQKEAEKKKQESMLYKELENDDIEKDSRGNVEISDDEEAQRKQIMDKEEENRALVATRGETVPQENSESSSASSDEYSSSSSSSNGKLLEGADGNVVDPIQDRTQNNNNSKIGNGNLSAENEDLLIGSGVKETFPPKGQQSTNAESDRIDDFSISSFSSEDKEIKRVAVPLPNPMENAIQDDANIEDDIDKIMTEDADLDSGDIDDLFSSDDDDDGDDDEEDSLEGWFAG
jgi:sugar lactone lactonase YvrE